MSRVLSLAGFQLTLIGRFWVIPEALHHGFDLLNGPVYEKLFGHVWLIGFDCF